MHLNHVLSYTQAPFAVCSYQQQLQPRPEENDPSLFSGSTLLHRVFEGGHECGAALNLGMRLRFNAVCGLASTQVDAHLG